MKVVQINAVYKKSSTGRSIMELHETLLNMGIESYIASPDLGSLTANAYKIGNKVDWKLHALFSRICGKQGYFSCIATKYLLDYLDYIQPDIIHLGNLHSNYINLPMLLSYISKKNIATVLTLHDCWFYTGKCAYYTIYKCERWLSKCGNCPDLHNGNKSFLFDKSSSMLLDKERLFSAVKRLAVIGVSRWITEDAKKSIIGNAQIVRCIYNWIDLDKFQPGNYKYLREKMGLIGKFVILGVSTEWSIPKGIDLFLNLADLLPDDCKIILVGNNASSKSKNEKINFLGSVNDINFLSKLYAISDVFVNPSLQETFGKTTAEAMACGTPVIAYNGTATSELVGMDENCGFLIDRNEATLYLEKILVIKEKTKKSYQKCVREKAKKMFSMEENIQKYLEVYQELLNED